MKSSAQIPVWTIAAPIFAGAVLLAAGFGFTPNALVGVIIAGIVLLPEGLAALRAARANRLQTSLNLALGSALASIGLTIPAVSFLSLYMNTRLRLGIDPKSSLLLMAPRGAPVNGRCQLRAATSSICLSRSAGSS